MIQRVVGAIVGCLIANAIGCNLDIIKASMITAMADCLAFRALARKYLASAWRTRRVGAG